MNYELIIVRYGEIALKGKEIRKRFESILVNNIKNALKTVKISNKLKQERGRIYIYTNQINKSITVLEKIFGITSISPANQTDADITSISKLAINLLDNKLNKDSNFAIRATRTGTHDFSSQDVAVEVGDKIVKSTKAGVDLTNPEFELFIEVRNKNAFLFTEKIRGVGGMPLGSQGNILAIIDSPESILASWYLMRRGCKTIFLKTKEIDTNFLQSFMDNWFVKSEILTFDKENINKTLDENTCNAIVTGHSLNNNSEEVISDIEKLKKHVRLPILNPLITMDAEEINTKIRQIGLKI